MKGDNDSLVTIAELFVGRRDGVGRRQTQFAALRRVRRRDAALSRMAARLHRVSGGNRAARFGPARVCEQGRFFQRVRTVERRFRIVERRARRCCRRRLRQRLIPESVDMVGLERERRTKHFYY
jgi:hypothetical protein